MGTNGVTLRLGLINSMQRRLLHARVAQRKRDFAIKTLPAKCHTSIYLSVSPALGTVFTRAIYATDRCLYVLDFTAKLSQTDQRYKGRRSYTAKPFILVIWKLHLRNIFRLPYGGQCCTTAGIKLSPNGFEKLSQWRKKYTIQAYSVVFLYYYLRIMYLPK